MFGERKRLRAELETALKRNAELADEVATLTLRWMTERGEWAKAAAEERTKLLDDSAAERAGLIQILADMKGAQAPAMVPWPSELPKVHKTEEDEILSGLEAQRQQVADAIQAKLDARVAHDLGVPSGQGELASVEAGA